MSYAVTCAKVALVFFCGRNQEDGGDTLCGPSSSILLVDFLHASTCSNHVLVISIDALLLLALSFPLLLHKVSCSSTKGDRPPLFFNFFSPSSRRHGGGGGLEKSAFAFNACLGLSYLGLGLWVLEERLRMGRGWGFGITPLHWWPLLLAQGFTWILIGLTTTLTTSIPHKRRLLSLFVTTFAAFLCGTSILQVYAQRYMTLKLFLDISSLPGALLFLISSFTTTTNLTSPHDAAAAAAAASLLHNPPLNLNGGEYCDEQDVIRSSGNNEQEDSVTPFANAGFFSKLSFWWMNSVMHKGYEKTIEENDIPKLSEKDLAGSCYSLFLDKLHDQQQKQKQKQKQKPASILWTIVSCHWRDILVSGIFALLKILMLSAGPLLLKSFINVSSGQGAFRYEGYMLALALFFAKCLESLSQRQWYFRTRRIGLQVRSLLAAAIFKKQLKLSNSAKMVHSSGEIMNYVTVDAYRIGEFPFWFHQIWTTVLQLCISLVILYQSVGPATIAAFVVILLTVACNSPLAKLQHKYQTRLMDAQDERLKAMSEALVHMKVLKLYAWEAHFMKVIQVLRAVECRWIQAFQLRRAYNSCLFWTSPVLVSAATFSTCYFLHIPLNAGNVFTVVATMRLVQDPVRLIPDVLGVFIQAKVAFTRILKFLDAPEMLQNGHFRRKYSAELDHPIRIKSASFSWDEHSLKPTLRNVNLDVKAGEKVAICGEVGSGKSTLLAAILGEVPKTDGTVHVCGKIAYVSQNAWIQTGTVQDNILFGSPMDKQRYRETLERCSLVKDIETLQFGDLTEIGERGVNLSGGQKQRLQLARALYQDADTYLLDDPFSAVDAHTATSLFNEYVMGALSSKTVLLVTHQVDFLPAFSFILLMSDGEVLHAAPYHELLASTKEFQDLVDAHKDSVGSEKLDQLVTQKKDKASIGEIILAKSLKQHKSTEASGVDQLIKKEERETGNTGLKPYLQYLNQDKGLLYASIAALCHVVFVSGQISQNSWMAAKVQNPQVSMLKLISVYLTIGFSTTIFLLFRSLFVVVLGMQSSKSLFSQLLHSLFRAPMSFFDSTPLGRILSRVSSDLSIVDLDVPFTLIFTFGSTVNAYSNLGVLTVITWQILFVALPLVYLTIRLQRYYFASAKELMRINGTTRSILANHLSETIAGTTTIRAFEEEDRFFTKNLELIDKNASPFFHNFAANEWLIQRLETVSAAILSSSALVMVLLPPGTFSSGFIGMALSYGLSLNMSLVFSIQNQCTLTNYIISVERLNQYMHVPSEAPEIVDGNRPAPNWPAVGRVELTNLQVRYRPESPLVLREISCTFEGGHKIGIVGRTGSGKTTLIGALFRLVEPVGGKITIDGLDITTIGLHDLRSRLGIIPQEPTLFQGSVRYNLDPLGHYTDQQIWEVLDKCQLREAVLEKENGLDSLVVEDGSNWSMGQRQLFCLGRALLKRSRILVLDEATASIDNATDAILQRTIRTEFAECTVITVAHRIPTVMDCTMVLAISYGKLVEYDEPMKLMNNEESLFGKLVKEYWSHSANPGI